MITYDKTEITIGKGSSRLVFVHPTQTRKVIKANLPTQMYPKSNMEELHIWNTASEAVKQHLAATYEMLDSGAIISEYCTPLGQLSKAHIMSLGQVTITIPCCLDWDNHYANLGLDALGKVKIIDYGLQHTQIYSEDDMRRVMVVN